MSRAVIDQESTSGEHALAEIWNSHGRLGHFIEEIPKIGIEYTPVDWVPHFIWEYGLEGVLSFVRDIQLVLRDGPEWQAARGTPRGFEIAFVWVQSDGWQDLPDDRHSWWEFQIGIKQTPVDGDQIRQLSGIAALTKTSESDLFRLFTPEHDFRPIRGDMHRGDEGLFDGYSGRVLWENGPLISIGNFGYDFVEDVWVPFVESSSTRGIDIVQDTEFDQMVFSRVDQVEIGRLPGRWPNAYPTGSWLVDTGPQSIDIL